MAYGVTKLLHAEKTLPEENALLCPMIDARRMEVYSSLYDFEMNQQREIKAEIIGEGSYEEQLAEHHIYFLGNGAQKCKNVLGHPRAVFIDDFAPSARFMIPFSEEKFDQNSFENVAYFEPFYLKDFIATVPRNKII
jgi:tRNA threonylcarbamoyladenosine biosynthesis protein TsaB